MSFGFFGVFHNSASASCVARDQTGGDLERGNKTNIDRRRDTDVGDDLHDGLHFRIIFNRDGGLYGGNNFRFCVALLKLQVWWRRRSKSRYIVRYFHFTVSYFFLRGPGIGEHLSFHSLCTYMK